MLCRVGLSNLTDALKDMVWVCVQDEKDLSLEERNALTEDIYLELAAEGRSLGSFHGLLFPFRVRQLRR